MVPPQQWKPPGFGVQQQRACTEPRPFFTANQFDLFLQFSPFPAVRALIS